tara:strand:- start:519 stop:650 length:132 start_codon:yes stop_codon:yes gene_type:complete
MELEATRTRLDLIEERLRILEENSHPPREFVTCEKCNNKIKEK